MEEYTSSHQFFRKIAHSSLQIKFGEVYPHLIPLPGNVRLSYQVIEEGQGIHIHMKMKMIIFYQRLLP